MHSLKTFISPALLSTVALAAAGFAIQAQAQDAGALRDKYSTLAPTLTANVYKRPIHLDSAEASNTVGGNVYAVLDAPFTAVSAAFRNPDNWCDVLMLHLNTKNCSSGAGSLKVHVGKKNPQELKDATALTFQFQPATLSAEYMAINLNAEKGPLGTSQYRIELQAVPLPGGKTFMHLRYGYGYGTASKLAMQAYLSTVASGKVGFTAAPDGNGYVGGMRGAVERNTMRYYLAIETYLATMSLQEPARQQARLERWFDATEQYARQLHEVDKASYLAMKKDEYLRQQSNPSS